MRYKLNIKRKYRFTIALVGPDGAGKTTMVQDIIKTIPLPIKKVYMGFCLNSSNVILPSSRFFMKIKPRTIGSLSVNPKQNSNSIFRKFILKFKNRIDSLIRFAVMINWLFEEMYRFGVAYIYQCLGYIILFDRHFMLDCHVYEIFNNRFHRFLLNHIYPKPYLIIYLDAPAEVLFERKGERNIQVLEQLRQRYFEFIDKLENFIIIDTTQSEKETREEIIRQILDHYEAFMDIGSQKPKAINIAKS